MKKYLLLMLLCEIFFSFTASAQYSRYIVRLKDKNGTSYTISNPSVYLSAKAIARRTKYKIAIDSTDLPIRAAYLDSIKAVPNVTILNVSKWLNQVCIKITGASALTKINSFSFVKNTSPVAVRVMQSSSSKQNKFEEYNPLAFPSRINDIAGTFGTAGLQGIQNFYNYGINAGQIHIHEGEYLHNLGFHGEGITIAVLDAGFYNYLINPAFDSIRLQNQILGTWDYVANEQSVNEDHYHGAMCLSTIAANEPGQMIGGAPKAKFWLLRTEDANSEYPVEEENWVAAAEFADSAGADMITSSLGYSDFDDPSLSLSYAQRDGKTSIISIGANMAARKGILVTNSAGNSGNSAGDAKYVICPADADSVLTIGATDVNGNFASFSSIGPNGAGKLKPNVVSVGWNAVVADPTSGTPVYGSGTSFSNPNMCGLVACLWQAFPEFSNMEVFDAVQKSASKYATPDNQFGYGIPNMRVAYLYLQQQRVIKNSQQALGNNWIKAFPVPFSDNLSVLLKAPLTGHANIRLTDMGGKTIETKGTDIQQDNMYTITFDKLKIISRGVYTVQYSDGKNKVSLRVIKQ
ncbi:MAG: S8 family serine peptidase, partial [Bacteroidota bacterium]